ncbi:HYD1 signature containing ADP-ribosyltransferase family protein [Kitasatospora terrestris]|uniref:Tox-ART-HYD1 domain-containing protein n=1 Tax=Kitasatospora terrestris TaxID=258051 RepID=A0ABP9DTG9_9ACTN
MAQIAESSASGPPSTLFHFTTERSMQAILASEELWPSLKSENPRDALYGNGQYLTDIPPGKVSPSVLSYALVRLPFAGRRFTHYVEIDVTGLEVKPCRESVYLVEGDYPLGLSGRIKNSGVA